MWKKGLSAASFERLKKKAQGLSEDNAPLPYSPEFDKNTDAINTEVQNLESNIEHMFRKHPKKGNPEIEKYMKDSYDRLYELKQALYALDATLAMLV
jgi:hypothetical protein